MSKTLKIKVKDKCIFTFYLDKNKKLVFAIFSRRPVLKLIVNIRGDIILPENNLFVYYDISLYLELRYIICIILITKVGKVNYFF